MKEPGRLCSMIKLSGLPGRKSLENDSNAELPCLMHETVFISQCIREIRANRPEVDSAAQCTVIACSFVVIPEVVSSADNSIFQEIIFRSDAGLKMAVLDGSR